MHRQKIQVKDREDDATPKSLNMSTESLNLSKSLNMSTESENMSNTESPPSSVTSSGVSPQEKRFRDSPPCPQNQ
jgi:hypothetical protein